MMMSPGRRRCRPWTAARPSGRGAALSLAKQKTFDKLGSVRSSHPLMADRSAYGSFYDPTRQTQALLAALSAKTDRPQSAIIREAILLHAKRQGVTPSTV